MKRLISAVSVAAALSMAPALALAATPAQEGTTATARQDLDGRIHQRIRADRSLRGYDIDVSVTDRVATLSGTVATEQQKLRAGRLAHVSGVRRVDNNITVDREAVRGTTGRLERGAESVGRTGEHGAETVGRTGEHVASKTGEVATDGWITSRIHERFIGVDELKGSDISVDTDNHVVTLKGSVLSEEGRRKAVEIAKSTEGVHDVVDHLIIGRRDRH